MKKFHKSVDVFSADLIFVIVTEGLHHSLCTIVNPGSIVNAYKRNESLDARRPMFVFMDALGCHDESEICRRLREWLNQCWSEERKRKAMPLDETQPFTSRKMPLITPVGKRTICRAVVCLFGVQN